MAKAKITKPLGAKPVKLAKVVKPLMPKTNQALQGPMGKAQGYTGHLSGKVPMKDVTKKKKKEEKPK